MDELDQERPWEAHAWLRAETLAMLAELNEQCLEMLTLQHLATSTPTAPLLRETGSLLRMMDMDARHRAAACPYLLFDAGFADQQRWSWVAGSCIRDMDLKEGPPFFTLQQTRSMARLVLTYAWHLARSQSAAARLLLGMTGQCSRLISVCTLRQIHDLAEAHPEWLQPRWANRPQFWRELLTSATSGDAAAMEQARLRGLQIMAAENRALMLA
ncbi:MAG TPA: hypothetical protein VG994_14265 [Steroidobacteraceae bacterium]|nr:hypothetical protein [Steroidobacteraceae bacterium]